MELKDFKVQVLRRPVLSRRGERFAIDFATARPIKERVPLDYNHENGEILGYCDGFAHDGAGVTANAHLVLRADVPAARANEVAALVEGGVPFEASPLVDLDGARVEEVREGETATINATEVAGPLVIYRDAIIRGVSVCPHGTDRETSFIAFASEISKNPELKGDTDMAEQTQDGETKKVVNIELETFIEEFGKDRGVDFYRSGKTIEEARAEDYAELKKWREEQQTKEIETPAGVETVEKKTDDEEIVKLAAAVETLRAELKELKAERRLGDPVGLSAAVAQEPPKERKPALVALAEYYKKRPAIRQ